MEKFMSQDKRVTIISNGRNLGWSAGNNVGIKAARGQLVVLLSNDTVVDRRWLSILVEIMDRDPSIGIAQPMILSIYDHKTLDSAGGFLDPLGYAYASVPVGAVDEVFHAEGVAMGIKRSVFDEIGLLDEDFFMEFDDHDFCWRARLVGYKVVVVTESIIFHVRGGVTGATLMTRRLSNIRRYTQNHLSAMIKNYELPNVIKFVPLASILEAGKALWFGARGSWPMARATLEGIIAVPLTFKSTWKKRLIIQSGRKLSDRSVLDNMLRFSPSALKLFYQYQTLGKRPFLSREDLARMRR